MSLLELDLRSSADGSMFGDQEDPPPQNYNTTFLSHPLSLSFFSYLPHSLPFTILLFLIIVGRRIKYFQKDI